MTPITKTELLNTVTAALSERTYDPELDNVETVSLFEDAVSLTYQYLTGKEWDGSH